MNIDIKKFLEKFNKEYNFLYDNNDNVAGYNEVVDFGDALIKKHKDFVAEFCRYRGDILSSDREVAAFAYAMEEYL